VRSALASKARDSDWTRVLSQSKSSVVIFIEVIDDVVELGRELLTVSACDPIVADFVLV
jgi:hypothetical protein